MKQLIPLLRVVNLHATIDFYIQVLGFEVCWREKGTVQVQHGNVALMFSTGDNLGSMAELSGTLYFYPEDVSTLWNSIRERVEIEWPLQTMDYGTREFGIRDPDGYILAFAEVLPAAGE